MLDIGFISGLSVVCILVATFWLKRLWLGALTASLLLIAARLHSGLDWHQSLTPWLNALVLSLDLALLLFGAYLFYDLMTRHRQLEAFEQRVEHLNSPLSTLLLLCWFLLSFLEGIAGFGIPAMLVAPLLITLRLRSFSAILLPLIAGTVATTFGALSTPIRVGLDLANPLPVVNASLMLNLLPALLMPLVLAWCYQRIERQKLNWREQLPLLLKAGLCFVVPYLGVGLIAFEFASVAGGLIGLLLFSKLVIPAEDRLAGRLLWHSFWPYLLFVVLLLLGKFGLQGRVWRWHPEYRALSLFQPGVIFIAAALLYSWIRPGLNNWTPLRQALIQTGKRTGFSILSIVILVGYTQLIRDNLPSLLQAIPELGSGIALAVSVSAGIAGSFLTGSATMSNLLFGSAIEQLLNPLLLTLGLALLNTGGAIGNCISLQNILMVKTVVRQPTHESQIIGRALPIALVYALLVVLTAMLL